MGPVTLDLARGVSKENLNVGSLPAIPAGTLTPAQVKALYNWPTTSAAGQTIGIYARADGYKLSDISSTCARWGVGVPSIQNVYLTQTTVANLGDPPPPTDAETTLDFSLIAGFAPGASIAVYFSDSLSGIMSEIGELIHPLQGQPTCDILSFSFVLGGPSATNSEQPVDIGDLNIAEALFLDAAIQGMTIIEASGDVGASPFLGATTAELAGWPLHSPWITTVGGTVIGNISGSSFVEWVWNDSTGASGGGVSKIVARPSYQSSASVPNSKEGVPGRGVPDIASVASPYSGYTITFNGVAETTGGTSAAAPACAGLIATINAALGQNVGFINPTLYSLGNSGGIIRDIAPTTGAANSNSFSFTNNGGQTFNVTGFPVQTGWDACTGWGVINGNAFLNYLRTHPISPPVEAQAAGADIWIQVQSINSGGAGPPSVTFGPIPIGGGPLAPGVVTAMYMTESGFFENNVRPAEASWLPVVATHPVTYKIYTTSSPSIPSTLTATYTTTQTGDGSGDHGIPYTALLDTLPLPGTYYMQIQASNPAGSGPMSPIHGPFLVNLFQLA